MISITRQEKKYDLTALGQKCSGAVFICSTIPKAKNFRLFGNLKKVQICFFIAFVLWWLQQIQKPVCWFGDDDIGRPYTDFNTLYAVDEQTRKMIRHQEYLDRRERQMSITYHDNMYVPPDQEDIQLLALQQALLMLKNLYQDKFEVIIGFYYGNYKTIKAYAVNCGISRQAMSKKLHKALEILRHICFEKLENLENWIWRTHNYFDCCNPVTDCDDPATISLFWLRLFLICAKIEIANLSLSV